jgi:hypothetical protein
VRSNLLWFVEVEFVEVEFVEVEAAPRNVEEMKLLGSARRTDGYDEGEAFAVDR